MIREFGREEMIWSGCFFLVFLQLQTYRTVLLTCSCLSKLKKHVMFYKNVDQEVNHVFYIVLNVLDCTRSYCWCVV